MSSGMMGGMSGNMFNSGSGMEAGMMRSNMGMSRFDMNSSAETRGSYNMGGGMGMNMERGMRGDMMDSMGSVMNNRNNSTRNFGGPGDMMRSQNSMSSRNFEEDLDFPFQSEGPGHGDRDFRTGSAAAKSSFVIGGHSSMQPNRDFGGSNFGGNNFGVGSSSSVKFGGDSFGNTGRGGGGGHRSWSVGGGGRGHSTWSN